MRRDTKGRFLMGHSGNPGGRPKGIVSFIREHTQDGEALMTFWLKIFNGEEIDGYKPTIDDRKQAAKELSDRGFGRPVQYQHIDNQPGKSEDQNNLDNLSDEELHKLAEILSKTEIKPGAA